jgi:hypothetical protein
MVTVTDKTYSYTHLIGWNEKQKTIIIKGQPEKKIIIDFVSLTLEAPLKGLATAWVTANGTQLGRWTVDTTTPQQVSAKPAYIAPTSGDVELILYLKSSSSTVKARASMLSYDYTIKEAEIVPEPEEPEITNCILVVCNKDDNIDLQVSQAREVVGDREIKVLREI